MKTNNIFNPGRVFYLIFRYIRLNYSPIITATAVVTGLILLISLVQMRSSGIMNQNYFIEFTTRIMFLGGIILAANSFRELNSSAKAPFYMNLPASILEKLAASWLSVSVLYLAYSFISILIINVLVSFAGQVFFDIPFKIVNLFSSHLLKNYAEFMVIQSVFIFGATYFRKSNFLKTLLWSFITAFIIMLFSVILHRIMLGNFNAFNLTVEGPFSSSNIIFVQNLHHVLKIAFWAITWPYFMIISFLSLKERQV